MAPDKSRRSRSFALLLAGAALVLSGCERHAVPPATRTHPVKVTAQAPSSINQGASDFISRAVGNDLYVNQAASIAGARAQDPAVRAFSAATAKASLVSRTKLIQSVSASGQQLTVPSKLTDHQQAMLDQLHRGTARDFDKTYIEQQIEADEDFLNLVSAYARSGGAAAIKDAAGALVPDRQDQLDKARSIQDALNKQP